MNNKYEPIFSPASLRKVSHSININMKKTKNCNECRKNEDSSKMFFVNFILGLQSLWYCEECFTGLCGDSLNDFFTQAEKNRDWNACSVCEVKELHAELGKGMVHLIAFCKPCYSRMIGMEGAQYHPPKVLAYNSLYEEQALMDALKDVQASLDDIKKEEDE
jgi:hypothetical protein